MAIDIKKTKKANHSKEGSSVLGTFAKLLNTEISFSSQKLTDKKKERFYSELNILLSSGIDIRSSLEILEQQQTNKNDKMLLQNIYADVVKGYSLSEAIHSSAMFSSYEYYSLRIGEESGRIKDILHDLSSYYSKKIKQRRQLTSALTYPVLVLVTAVFAVGFMLNFIVPMFMDIFKRFNGEVPYLTQIIISASIFLRTYSLLIVFVVLCIFVLIFWVRKTESFRAKSSAILLKMPLFGTIVNKIYIVRFCQSMSLLLSAKTPMLRSLQLVKHMVDFYPFEVALDKMENDILHGKELNKSMLQFDLFDSRMIALVRVAEEVNQLDVIFARLNDQYNDELEHQISMLSSLMEPVMIIVVGGLVAVILISMYLPIFQLSTSVF